MTASCCTIVNRAWMNSTYLSADAGTRDQHDLLSVCVLEARPLFLRRLDDRVVAGGVEAEEAPGLLHVRRQRCCDVDGAAARMRHGNPARQKMQPVLHAPRQLPVLL